MSTTKVPINDLSINDTNVSLKVNDNDHNDNDQKVRTNYGIPGSQKSALLMLLLWGVCIIFRFVGVAWSKVRCGTDDANLIEICLKHSAIYRVTTVTISVLILQSILSMYSIKFFDYYWIIKYPIFILGSFVLLYPVTYSFNDVSFEWIARICAFFFLIFQQFLILDFAYYFNETLLEKAGVIGRVAQAGVDESDCGMVLKNSWLIGILVVASFNFTSFIIAFVLLYHYFAPAGTKCNDNVSIISITFSLMILAVIIQLAGSNGSVITSSILAIYVTYVIYCAMTLNPNIDCNASLGFHGSGNDRVGPVVLGIIMSFLSIAYAAIVSSKSIAAIMTSGTYTTPGIIAIVAGKQSNSNSGFLGTNLDFDNKLKWTVINLNFIYILLSFYISMIMSNWGTISMYNSVQSSVASGNSSMWISASAAWICILLYIIQLLIPNFNIFPKSIWDFRIT